MPYNNKTRKGGKFVLHSSGNIPNKVPVTPEYVSDFSIRFSEQLPQPFSALDPNYDPTLRGFYIVNKKTIQAIAYVGLGDDRLNSNIASIQIEHSALQKGLWTLPVPPLSYNGSQINRATYINLNN